MYVVDHIGMVVKDFDATVNFYRILEFEVIKEWLTREGTMRACMMQNAQGICIEVFCTERAVPAPEMVGTHIAKDGEALEAELEQIGHRHLAFRVENLEEVAEKLIEAGLCKEVEILPGGMGNKYMFVRDPSGMFVEFMDAPPAE